MLIKRMKIEIFTNIASPAKRSNHGTIPTLFPGSLIFLLFQKRGGQIRDLGTMLALSLKITS